MTRRWVSHLEHTRDNLQKIPNTNPLRTPREPAEPLCGASLQFTSAFPKAVGGDDTEASNTLRTAKYAVSNLIGGFGFFHGRLEVRDAEQGVPSPLPVVNRIFVMGPGVCGLVSTGPVSPSPRWC